MQSLKLINKQETGIILLMATHSSLLFLTAWTFGSYVFFGKKENTKKYKTLLIPSISSLGFKTKVMQIHEIFNMLYISSCQIQYDLFCVLMKITIVLSNEQNTFLIVTLPLAPTLKQPSDQMSF